MSSSRRRNSLDVVKANYIQFVPASSSTNSSTTHIVTQINSRPSSYPHPDPSSTNLSNNSTIDNEMDVIMAARNNAHQHQQQKQQQQQQQQLLQLKQKQNDPSSSLSMMPLEMHRLSLDAERKRRSTVDALLSANKKTQPLPKTAQMPSRKHRRVLNDMYLKKHALRLRETMHNNNNNNSMNPMDYSSSTTSSFLFNREELKQLYTIPYHSAFTELYNDPNAYAAFQPFISITEEEQDLRFELQERQRRKNKKKQHKKQHQDGSQSPNQQLQLQHKYIHPAQAWKKVNRNIRHGILSNKNFAIPFIRSLEEQIKDCPPTGICISLDDPFQRLVAHGVAQYYNMSSKSTNEATAAVVTAVTAVAANLKQLQGQQQQQENGTRKTWIRPKINKTDLPMSPQMMMSDYLFQLT